MYIKWLAHASFLFVSENNTRIIVDPYHSGQGLNHAPPSVTADIVTKSHDHNDHNNIRAIRGNPDLIDSPGSRVVKGIGIKAIPVYHDEDKGRQRGTNLMFCFNIDGLNLCHLGDLGHLLTPAQLSEIGPIDILFVPVGGYYTIDAEQAAEVVQSIKPVLTFPMHYKTHKTDYPIAPVDDFLKEKSNVRRVDSSEIEVRKDSLPEAPEIIVLQPAN